MKRFKIEIPSGKFHRWLLILLGLGLLAALYYVSQTPEYALYRWRRAIERRDLATFYSYLDLPQVINSIKDAENTRRIRMETGSEWQALARAVETQVSKVLSTGQVHLVQREIEGRFRNTTLPPPPDLAFGDLLATRNFLLEARSFKLGSVARRGKGALANLDVTLPKLKKTYSLLLVLEKEGQWRVSGLEGLASTLDEYAQDQKRYLEVYNEELRARLAQSLKCSGSLRQESALMGLSQALRVEVRCKNLFPDTITALAGEVTLNSSDGRVLKAFPLAMNSLAWTSREDITLQQEHKIGLIEGRKGEVFTAPSVRVVFRAQEVTFANGQILRPEPALKKIP